MQFARMQRGLPNFIPSRLFVYYNERDIEGSVASDSGAAIRDGITAITTFGDTPEDDWPYDPDQFATKPPQRVYDAAHFYTAFTAARVYPMLDSMRTCLAGGSPIVIGFTCYDSFESVQVANTGVLDLPQAGEQALGGHAVLVVGYDDATQRFIVRNSWGPDWGKAGYFTIPYAYLTNPDLADDFWRLSI
jgi:C1A family cysteine protease